MSSKLQKKNSKQIEASLGAGGGGGSSSSSSSSAGVLGNASDDVALNADVAVDDDVAPATAEASEAAAPSTSPSARR